MLKAVLLGVVFIWSFWPTLSPLIRDWKNDPNYSIGMLVPVAALYLIWQDWGELKHIPVRPSWWGLLLIAVGLAGLAFGLMRVIESAERYSMVVVFAGVVLLVAGWRLFREVGWVLCFLLLMVPLPGRIHNAISGPLQGLATQGALFTLELMGDAVAREGNILRVEDESVAVAEACSGLRMLAAFVVVGAVLAYVVSRPRWQKVILVSSTVPVAIFCNLVRLVVTVQLFKIFNAEVAKTFFHDFAGWTMMPLGVALLCGELWLMSLLMMRRPTAPSADQAPPVLTSGA